MEPNIRERMKAAKYAYETREWSKARLHLEYIVDAHPGYADMIHLLGMTYHALGLFSRAQTAFEKAMHLNPAYTEAALNLAVLYNDLGRYDDARHIHQQMGERQQKERTVDSLNTAKIANLHAQVGDAYRQSGALSEAAREYAKALELCPGFADIRVKLANAYRDNTQHIEAKQHYAQAITDRPNYADAHIQLGLCHYMMNEIDEAIVIWKRIAAEHPSHTNASMYLSMVRSKIHPPPQ